MSANLPIKNQHLAKSDIDLQSLFCQCFEQQFNTRLRGNAIEPLYSPSSAKQAQHVIFYRDDYFSSALHEIAHWCIAGDKRRLQTDYGYWYAPDGRSAQQQKTFALAEQKPQALEWAFSIACNIPFRVSIDNLAAQDTGLEDVLVKLRAQEEQFTLAVNTQLKLYIERGFPTRAQLFLSRLHTFYSTQSFFANDERLIMMPLSADSTI
ncbi:conserved hypothetical protein [Glaciecola punicea ACAM 611]|jgi:hypothetical protein|uniref:Transporting ATPase n=1 Tax=Glaciecola punicea ACAM 611 TaxID=1121923 RepID=H5T8T3_9ALTE|nr:elongation factor P hydroxylase [Glaciecola punicea]GAB54710.1 conserved hypothetical protein [Glaciecola punicea ACAM 611]